MHPEIQKFLDREERKENEGTYGKRLAGLRVFDEWLESEGLSPDEIGPLEIEDFAVWLKSERGIADNTAKAYIGQGPSKFYQYRAKREEIDPDDNNPVRKADLTGILQSPSETEWEKESRSAKPYIALTEDEVTQLIDNAPGPKLRNQLIIKLFVQTGLRPGELCQIRLEDLDRENNRVRIRAEKTHNNRTIRYQDSLDFYLSQYIDGGYRDSSPYAESSEYLFVTHRSERLVAYSVNTIIKEAAEKAGIQEKILEEDANGNPRWKVTAKTLRHTFADLFIQNGGEISRLKEIMGHSKITTTEKYLHASQEILDKNQEKFAPDV